MKIEKNYLIMRQPDDWHSHLREGELMAIIINLFNIYGRVVCMGNLTDPVDNLQKLVAYYQEIDAPADFLPIIGVMLTKNSTVEEWEQIVDMFYGRVMIKYMSEGITTNSGLGVTWQELENYYQIFELAQRRRIPILLHAEIDKDPITGEPLPEIDREEATIPYVAKLARTFPRAIINVEHVSTRAMIRLIWAHANLSGSISPNHLIHTYRDVFDEQGRMKNIHKYFKPVAKRAADQEMIRAVALGGSSKFFFGSDSAPHYRTDKEQFQRAGAFNALTNLAYLTELFEKHDALDERFEDFVSNNGAARYGFPLNTQKIILRRRHWTVPKDYHGIVPDLAGRDMSWQVEKIIN